MHRLFPAIPWRGWPEGHLAFWSRGNFTGHRTRIGRFDGIGPTLIGHGHDEVGDRSCLVALEQNASYTDIE